MSNHDDNMTTGGFVTSIPDDLVTARERSIKAERLIAEYTAPPTAKLATALAAAQGEIGGALKDSTNPHFRSSYADLASVWDACRAPLSRHGIAVVQMPRVEDGRCYVKTVLIHSSGEQLSSEMSTRLDKDTPQVLGSCITYLRRYGLMSMAGIAPDDDDGEAATNRNKPTRKPRAKPTHKPFTTMSPSELVAHINSISTSQALNDSALKDAIKAIEDDTVRGEVRGAWELHRAKVKKRNAERAAARAR